MKSDRQEVLTMLSTQETPKYASWFVNHRPKRWGHLWAQDFADQVLSPLVGSGLVEKVMVKSKPTYRITAAGRAAIIIASDEPLQITPGRLISKMCGTYVPERGDVASQRGAHRHILSVGVAC